MNLPTPRLAGVLALALVLSGSALAQDAAPAGKPPAPPSTAPAAPGQTTAPPAQAPAAAPALEAPPPAAGASSDASFNMHLRGIEERVNDLKEKIFQSKARLIQLQEVVLHGAISGAKAILIHKNEMGSSFVLSRVQYSLDGAPIFNRVDNDGDLDDLEEIEIFNGSIAPGNHQVSVFLEYQGHGYGVFSYLKGYTFRVKSSYTFTAEEGKSTTVRVVGYEKGGFTAELKDRPDVRFAVEIGRALSAAEAQQGQGKEAGKAGK